MDKTVAGLLMVVAFLLTCFCVVKMIVSGRRQVRLDLRVFSMRVSMEVYPDKGDRNAGMAAPVGASD